MNTPAWMRHKSYGTYCPVPGPAGPRGPTGPAGAAGINGSNGAIGPVGPTGADGSSQVALFTNENPFENDGLFNTTDLVISTEEYNNVDGLINVNGQIFNFLNKGLYLIDYETSVSALNVNDTVSIVLAAAPTPGAPVSIEPSRVSTSLGGTWLHGRYLLEVEENNPVAWSIRYESGSNGFVVLRFGQRLVRVTVLRVA